MFVLVIVGDVEQKIIKHGEGVRDTMSKIRCIIFVVKVICKTKSVITSFFAYTYIVFHVRNLLATTSPDIFVVF